MNSTKIINARKFIAILALMAGALHADELPNQEKAIDSRRTYETTEWLSFRVEDVDKSDLPRILLIGDSICGSYTEGVKHFLAGKATVSQLGTSKAICLPEYFDEIRMALRASQYAVIHFNNGLHGWGYSEAEYAKNLGELVKLLKTSTPNAKLIWATTTQLRSGSPPYNEFSPNNARVKARNAIAAEIMARNDIPSDDLYSLMEPHHNMLSDGTHYKKDGNDIITNKVIACIAKALKSE